MGRNDFRFFKNTLPKLSFLHPKSLKLYPSKHVETSKYLGRVCAPEGAKSGRNESLPMSGGDQWYHGYFQWRHCNLKNVPNFSEGFWSLAHRKIFLAFQRVKRNAAEIFPTLQNQRVKPNTLRPQAPSAVDFGGITFFQGCAALKNQRAKRADFVFFRVGIEFFRVEKLFQGWPKA